MKLSHMLVNANFVALLKAGLNEVMARFIAGKLRLRKIIEVAISDAGVHIAAYEEGVEKAYIFKFNT